jgi:putative transposase
MKWSSRWVFVMSGSLTIGSMAGRRLWKFLSSRCGIGLTVQAYGRRVGEVDRMILACFVLGVSTRKVAQALLPVLGESVSATTVSRVAKTLDGAVEAFHRRPISRRYRFLVLDGVVLKRRTGAGSVKRVVLVALGITAEGRKE